MLGVHALHPGQELVAASLLGIRHARVGVAAVVEAQGDGGGDVVLADKIVAV